LFSSIYLNVNEDLQVSCYKLADYKEKTTGFFDLVYIEWEGDLKLDKKD